MIKSKFVAFAAAATLAVAPCLAACGGQQSSTSGTESSSSQSATTDSASSVASSTSTAPDLATYASWSAEGTTDDHAFGILYSEVRSTDDLSKAMATLVLVDTQSSIATTFKGEAVEADGRMTLTDAESGAQISYTSPDMKPETGEIKFTIDERGDVTLTMVENTKFDEDLALTLETSDRKIAEANADEGNEGNEGNAEDNADANNDANTDGE